MAWLSGLADKAENLLNKIDKNTAAVLNKDKYDTVQSQLTEIAWVPNQSRLNNNAVAKSDHQESPKNFPSVRSTPNLKSLTPTNREVSKEEELFTYLNILNESPRKDRTDSLISPPTPSSLLVEHPIDNTDSISEFSLRSDQSSPCLTHTSIDILDTDEQDHGQCVKSETIYLSNDTESLNNTILNSHVIGNIIENGQISIEDQSEALQQECELQFRKNGMAVNKLVDLSDAHLRQHLRNVERDLQERNELLGKQKTDHQKEIMILNGKLQSLEAEKAELLKQIIDLQFALERNRLELNSTRSELDQHKARALKTLQEKEKLIAELKSNASTTIDDATVMELNQLRQERDTLRDENQQKCEQLRIIRDELANVDLKLEKMRQKSTDASIQAQEILATERRRRLDAEEDVRLHSEEIRSLKDELLRERNSFTLQLQKVESEVSRLRLQLSTTATPSSEVESRLASLTQTLVSKQQALEDLTTERNALRLQLEKIEHEFRNVLGNSRRNLSYNNMNDTDDAKAQVPTFLMETPFDTGVTRRVKRAYSSLDAISVRTGVFLRRYPLARILVLIYMALLQFWVLVVLFSQSPEAH